jgi:hypothetical protein
MTESISKGDNAKFCVGIELPSTHVQFLVYIESMTQ